MTNWVRARPVSKFTLVGSMLERRSAQSGARCGLRRSDRFPALWLRPAGRELPDSADTIAAFARDASEFLRTGKLTAAKACVRFFVNPVLRQGGAGQARRGGCHLNYSTPQDSLIKG